MEPTLPNDGAPRHVLVLKPSKWGTCAQNGKGVQTNGEWSTFGTSLNGTPLGTSLKVALTTFRLMDWPRILEYFLKPIALQATSRGEVDALVVGGVGDCENG